jgi:hypothetical protein
MNKLCCAVCNKQYTRKSSLDKHKILCDFKLKTQRERQIEVEELGDMPSNYQLIQIVQELSLKISFLEEKMNEMQKLLNNKKKKMDVILWLNSNINPPVGFLEWVNTSIIVTVEHFEHLMKHQMHETIQKVFEHNLPQNGAFYPICCFSQKQGIFYICEKNEHGVPEWTQLELSNMTLILKILQNNMIKALTIWKTDNKQLIETNDKVSDSFNKAIIKLMDISFSQDSKMSRIKNGLYNHLKMNVNFTAVEVEFNE